MTIKLLYEKLATYVAMLVPATKMATTFQVLIYHHVREAFFVFFYVGRGSFFTHIHESQDCRGRARAFH